MSFSRRTWFSEDAVVLVPREFTRDELAVELKRRRLHPFPLSICDGHRALAADQLADVAVALGAPPHVSERPAWLREHLHRAIERGDVLVLQDHDRFATLADDDLIARALERARPTPSASQATPRPPDFLDELARTRPTNARPDLGTYTVTLAIETAETWSAFVGTRLVLSSPAGYRRERAVSAEDARAPRPLEVTFTEMPKTDPYSLEITEPGCPSRILFRDEPFADLLNAEWSQPKEPDDAA